MLLYRTIVLLFAAGGGIVGIILVCLLVMSWSNAERLRALSSHFDTDTQLRQVYQDLAEVADRTAETGSGVQQGLPQIADRLRRLAESAAYQANSSKALAATAARLESADLVARGTEVTAALAVLGRVLLQHEADRRAMLEQGRDKNERELQAMLALGIILPVFALAFFAFFHRRVLAPLNDLSIFFGLLARKEYTLAATDNVDPLVRPIFEKYNRMVGRMRDLEQGHVKREGFLQREVDQATRALFQQQAAMSRIERLAAVGEVSARLSHELRNPLSGVLMALTNLRSEIDSQDQDERLGLAISELERIGHLLSSIVEESRQVPERPRRLDLRSLVEEVIALARYRLSEAIELNGDVPNDLFVRLPEAGLRYALLNLVLNAAEALGGRSGAIDVVAERTSENIAISVRDTGPGFPDALLRTGVHEFGTWRLGGTGLGLATVRRFAFANSGGIRLENPAEGGACVTLLFARKGQED
jgi:signal transduction histidine kinase